MQVISLLTRKGGSGKSTLSTHWAVQAETNPGQRAVILDFDPQGSCSSWYSKRESETPLLIQSNPRNVQSHLEACQADGTVRIQNASEFSITGSRVDVDRRIIQLHPVNPFQG